MNTTLSRRSVLTGAAAVVTGSSIAGITRAAPADHPDAELIATYAKFVSFDREYIIAAMSPDWREEDSAVYFEKWRGLLDVIGSSKPKTPEGLSIIALAALRAADTTFNGSEGVLAWDGYSRPPSLDEDGEFSDHILWNIVESARAMTGKGGVA